ncbi:uncharacterized protein BYT42DRAFT_356205 [Radiomyces spectabilis]|uniref:uncharacterized protein n=1 Tax=Radiomyces spectabilis TaxID=64574 RepID=UPI00221E5499|nr:uncharacterized protein BYT42DRAFT_356205 [Radiomyces spectabilis]KAI8377744.1 hypothetical protein BYT42DRAFT_356205 [Radiomyces spectabilis]
MSSSIQGQPSVNGLKIVVAADGSDIAKQAIDYAANLCQKLSVPHLLQVLYVTGVNPCSIPFLDTLDRFNNRDIERDAQNHLDDLKFFMSKYDDIVNYTIRTEKEQRAVEYIITDYVNENPPDMLVLGSSNREGIQKYVLGSVSDYCLHHCHCPVTIIKHNVQGSPTKSE